MAEGPYLVKWADGRAVVTLPEHIDVSNAGQISEQLLVVINRGAAELIVDMAATVSCDHAGADAVARAYQRAAGNGTSCGWWSPHRSFAGCSALMGWTG